LILILISDCTLMQSSVDDADKFFQS
jgi:hypothetical protein